MTVHSTAFPTDQKVAAAVVAEALPPPAATAPPVLAAKKFNLRKLLLAGAAGHGFGAGRSETGCGKFVPCGLVDDLTRLVVGTELRTPAVAAQERRFCSSHVLT